VTSENDFNNDTDALSSSQRHGFAFEGFILGTKGLERIKGSTTFDAPVGAFEDGCALNIKTTHNDHIELADATRVWMWHRNLEGLAEEGEETPSILFVIGRYVQEGNQKVVNEIWEIKLDLSNPDVRKRLFGDVTVEDVRAFHDGINKEWRPDPAEAKRFAYAVKKKLQPRGGLVRLSPKVQEKVNQRRLQCVVDIADLVSCVPEVDAHCYTGIYRGLELPLVIEGGPRQYSAAKQAEMALKAAERERLNAEKKQKAIERDLQKQAQQAEIRTRKAAEKEARRVEREQKKQIERDIARRERELKRIQARMARLTATEVLAVPFVDEAPSVAPDVPASLLCASSAESCLRADD
jgi:hypothetical protein